MNLYSQLEYTKTGLIYFFSVLIMHPCVIQLRNKNICRSFIVCIYWTCSEKKRFQKIISSGNFIMDDCLHLKHKSFLEHVQYRKIQQSGNSQIKKNIFHIKNVNLRIYNTNHAKILYTNFSQIKTIKRYTRKDTQRTLTFKKHVCIINVTNDQRCWFYQYIQSSKTRN